MGYGGAVDAAAAVLTSTRELMRLDHAVFLVPDLQKAVAAFGAAGFTVTPGGVHTGGATQNALIVFSDGTYLELLAFTRRLVALALPILGRMGLESVVGRGGDPMVDRFRTRAVRGAGWIDFAVRPTTMERGLERARRDGVRIDGPIDGGRAGEGDERIAWELGLPAAPELPFLCVDVTKRELRVPGGAAAEHANGALCIASITVAVERLESSSARYRALLGVDPEPAPPEGLSVARGRTFDLDGARVLVASADDAGHPIRRHLRSRGEGPMEVTVRVSPECPDGPLDILGARLRRIRTPT